MRRNRNPVPLPPLDEQRRIVGILNRAAKIERRAGASAAERFREFIPALFVKMFGDPVANRFDCQVSLVCRCESAASDSLRGHERQKD